MKMFKALSLLLLVSSTSARIGQENNGRDLARRRLIKVTNEENKIANQYIVRVTKNTERSALMSRLVGRNPQSSILHEYKDAFQGFTVSGTSEDIMLDLIEQYPNSIIEIEEDSMVYASEVTWNLDRIDGNDGLDDSFMAVNTGKGIDVYVIDTGTMITHEEFETRGQPGMDFTGEGDATRDVHGHGTHVAGTVGGKKYGVAPEANIIPVKVLGSDGSGSNSGVIAGIDWVASKAREAGKTVVANLSLGGGFSSSLNKAVAAASANQVVMVVAAGNADSNACTTSPAAAQSAITVGATARFPLDARSSFSNKGGCVDIFAPGSDIKAAWSSSNRATNTISGTSMASPHVAGAVALLLESDPSLDAVPAGENILAMATEGEVLNAGVRSPNLMLYIGDIGRKPEIEEVDEGQTKITLKVDYGDSGDETQISLYRRRAGLWTRQENLGVHQRSLLGRSDHLEVTRELPNGDYALYLYDSGRDGLDGGGSFSLISGEPNENDPSVFMTGGEFESWTSVEFRVRDGEVIETRSVNPVD